MKKTLHTIWLGDEYPRWALYNIERFLHLHPTWEINKWLNPQNENFIQNNPFFSEMKELYDSYVEHWTKEWLKQYARKINEANLLRVLILKEFSGLYMDTDILWLVNINSFVNEQEIWGVDNFTYMYIDKKWPHWEVFMRQYEQMLPYYMDLLKDNTEEPLILRSHYFFWRQFFETFEPIDKYEDTCIDGIDDEEFKQYQRIGVLNTKKLAIHRYRHGI